MFARATKNCTYALEIAIAASCKIRKLIAERTGQDQLMTFFRLTVLSRIPMYTGSSIRVSWAVQVYAHTCIHMYMQVGSIETDRHTARSVKHCEEIIIHGSLGWRSRDWTPHAARVTVGDGTNPQAGAS